MIHEHKYMWARLSLEERVRERRLSFSARTPDTLARQPAGRPPHTAASRIILGLFRMKPESPKTCRRFPLSSSEGERAGARGPLGGCGAQSASKSRGLLSHTLSSKGGEGEPHACGSRRPDAPWHRPFHS